MRGGLRRIRLAILFALLIGLGGFWATSTFARWSLERELGGIARQKKQAETAQGLVAASVVTVTREHVLYGQALGKIEIFSQPLVGDAPIMGVEYRYIRDNGKWAFVESGGCSGAECQTRGAAALQAALPASLP